MHENVTQRLDGKYQRIGVIIFAVGATLSVLGELELIAIMFKLPLTVIPKFIPEDMASFSAIFYLILGNLIMLIECQFFRK
jgi:hypothetical protein